MGPPEKVVALWQRLEERWDDQALHREFLAACLEAGALAFGAQRYRSRDDETARAQLERLTTLGVQAMKSAEVPGRVNPRPYRVFGWALFILLCLALIVFFFLARTS